jgi:hypothetical protein
MGSGIEAEFFRGTFALVKIIHIPQEKNNWGKHHFCYGIAKEKNWF